MVKYREVSRCQWEMLFISLENRKPFYTGSKSPWGGRWYYEHCKSVRFEKQNLQIDGVLQVVKHWFMEWFSRRYSRRPRSGGSVRKFWKNLSLWIVYCNNLLFLQACVICRPESCSHTGFEEHLQLLVLDVGVTPRHNKTVGWLCIRRTGSRWMICAL